MKYIPFPIIEAAKKFDPEAVEFVLRHFEGYMIQRSLNISMDEFGNTRATVDDDLYYQARLAVLSAISTFQFKEPPPDFAP